jgi:hypothetical protein
MNKTKALTIILTSCLSFPMLNSCHEFYYCDTDIPTEGASITEDNV